MVFLVCSWAFPVFLAAADRKSTSCNVTSLVHNLDFSGDDSTCLCAVGSIQEDLRHSPIHLRTANNLCLRVYWGLLQSWYLLLRYVSKFHCWNQCDIEQRTHTYSSCSSVSIAKVLDFAYCNYTNSTTITTDLYFTLPRFVLSVLLLVLALTRTLKESVIIYRATKRWQPSQLVTLLIRDGIFYFSM